MLALFLHLGCYSGFNRNRKRQIQTMYKEEIDYAERRKQ